MPIKLPYTITKVDDKQVPHMNQNWERLYSHKLESHHKRESTGTTSYVHQFAEHGQVSFSATGSPTVALTFALKEVHENVVYVNAHALSTQVSAHVTDITQTAITITCRVMDAKGTDAGVSGTITITDSAATFDLTASFSDINFSNATTASVTVFYQVIGAGS